MARNGDCSTRKRGVCKAQTQLSVPGRHGYMVEDGEHAIAVAALFEARRRLLPIMRTRPLDCALRDLWLEGCASEKNAAQRVMAGDLSVLDALPDSPINWIGCELVSLKGATILRFVSGQWIPQPP